VKTLKKDFKKVDKEVVKTIKMDIKKLDKTQKTTKNNMIKKNLVPNSQKRNFKRLPQRTRNQPMSDTKISKIN